MATGGFLALINATPYGWVLRSPTSSGMNAWDSAFPASIPPTTAARIYIEFDDDASDSGSAIYTFGDFQLFFILAYGSYSDSDDFNPHVQIQTDGFNTPNNPSGTILELAWNHGYPEDAFGFPLNPSGNGCVTYILSMDPAGNLHSSADENWSTWMQANLGTLGGRTLRQLCMPGTHDSGMGQIGSCTFGANADFTQAQSQGILGQLKQGARYFDIRPMISDGTFVTGHYSYITALGSTQGCNGQSIAGIISDINSFTSGGAELIILSLGGDMNTDVGEPTYRPLDQEEWNSLRQELQGINALYLGPAPKSILAIVWESGTVTVWTDGPHGFNVGATLNVYIYGLSPSGYTGTFLCTVTSSLTFTYVLASNPGPTSDLSGMYYPIIDLSKLTLNDYIGSGQSAVVVIVDPSNDNLKNTVLGSEVGKGFYYPGSLPINVSYADKDDLDMMVTDQIAKLQRNRGSPDDEMFMLDWMLTQQTIDIIGNPKSILKLANWANPWIGNRLWPYLSMNCFPNILTTDDINSVYYDLRGAKTTTNSCLTAALAIAINNVTAPDTAPVKKVNTFHDASGKVTVSVFSRQSSWPREIFSDFGVTVDPDMVCVGGGAIGDDNPGGLLTASYPNEDLSGWLLSSKDHAEVDVYRLTAFAIGLKIDGMTRQQLMNNVSVQFADSEFAEHPEAFVSVPSGWVLIGGGFKVDWHGDGSIATASFPDGPTTWRARSKDHLTYAPAIIRVYAIGLSPRLLPVGDVIVDVENTTSSPAMPHPASTAILPQGFAITGGGAEVHYTGAGNLLWKLEPTQTDSQDFTAASKDQVDPDSATITSYVLGIRIMAQEEPPTLPGRPMYGIVGKSYSSGFDPTGVPPPTVTQIRGQLPPHLHLYTDGSIKGTPSQAGAFQFTVQAVNPLGSVEKTVEIDILGPPSLPSDPADGAVGKSYSSGFDATGMPPPTVTQVGGERPPGLTLHSDGRLTDVPTQAGAFRFTVQAVNDVGTAEKTVTVTIGAAPPAPTITGLTNGDGKVSVAFSDTSPVTSPITSYTVTATDDSNATGTHTATGPSSPIEVSGLINGDTYEFTVTATSAVGTSPPSASSGRLNVGVAPTLPSDPADGAVGKSYSSGFDATGAPPPTVTQVSGDRVPGLTLYSDGTLKGTPTQAGNYTFTVQATNDVGIVSKTVTVTISP
jgi:Fibronectin type III domain